MRAARGARPTWLSWGDEVHRLVRAGDALVARAIRGRSSASRSSVTVFTIWLASTLPREVLPQVDEGTAVAELRLPPGTAIEETVRQAARIEAAAKRLGSVGVYERVGVATDEEVLSGAEPGTPGTAVFVIPVPPKMAAAVFADSLRKAVPDLAGGLAGDRPRRTVGVRLADRSRGPHGACRGLGATAESMRRARRIRCARRLPA